MILRLLTVSAATAAFAATLALAAPADQVFQNVSTGKLPAPTATYNPNNVPLNYVYYPCASNYSTGDGRFNPFGAANHNGPLNANAGRSMNGCQRGGNRHRQPPTLPPGPGRVVPFATPKS